MAVVFRVILFFILFCLVNFACLETFLSAGGSFSPVKDRRVSKMARLFARSRQGEGGRELRGSLTKGNAQTGSGK